MGPGPQRGASREQGLRRAEGFLYLKQGKPKPLSSPWIQMGQRSGHVFGTCTAPTAAPSHPPSLGRQSTSCRSGGQRYAPAPGMGVQRWVQRPPDRTRGSGHNRDGRAQSASPNAAVTPWSAWRPEVWGTFWILAPADLPASGGTITGRPQALWHGSPEGGRIWAPIRRGHGDQSASCVQDC